MAKINARGARELARVTMERTGKNYRDRPETVRATFVLRSDGAILWRRLWFQEEGEERDKRSSAWSEFLRFKNRDAASRDAMVTGLTRRGWVLVTDEQQAAERQATAQAAVEKRREARGPELSDAAWSTLYRQAHEAGMAAGEAVTPEPMVVNQHANQMDDRSPVVRSYVAAAGPCGFAYVKVRPADGSFGKWARRARGWRAAYNGGLERPVHEFGQSVDRKGAYAQAFARVLKEAGINAFGYTRMD